MDQSNDRNVKNESSELSDNTAEESDSSKSILKSIRMGDSTEISPQEDRTETEQADDDLLLEELDKLAPAADRPVEAEYNLDTILDSIGNDLIPPKVPLLYRLGIIVAALSLICSAGAYLATCVAAVSSSIWAGRLALRAYRMDEVEMPIVIVFGAISTIAGVLFLVLLKPLVIRRLRTFKPHRIKRKDEPDLFRLVDRLCDVFGAPKPQSIALTHDVAAAAGYGGIGNFLTGRTEIGLGLGVLAGMRIRNVAGILAHEIGHLSQGFGVRLFFIGQTIDGWFTRATEERDALDRFVASRVRRSKFGPIQLIWRVFALLFFIPRLVLRIAVFFSRLFGSFFYRQMEHHADQCSALISGTDSVRRSLMEYSLLNHAEHLAMLGVDSSYKEGSLCEDLPRMIALSQKLIRPELRFKIWKRQTDEKPRLFASHPTYHQRVTKVERSEHPDRVDSYANGLQLLNEPDDLCRKVTLMAYKAVLGRRLKKRKVAGSEKIAQDLEQVILSIRSLGGFYQNVATFDRPVSFDRKKFDDTPRLRGARESVTKSREKMELSARSVHAAAQRYFEGKNKVQTMNLLNKLQELKLEGFSAALRRSGFVRAMKKAMKETSREGSEQMDRNRTHIEEFEKIGRDRLQHDLSLMLHSEISQRIEDGDALKEEVPLLLDVLALIKKNHKALMDLNSNLSIYRAHTEICETLEEFARYAKKAQSDIDQQVCTHNNLAELPYPFDHALGKVSVAAYLLERVPESDDFMRTFSAADEMGEKAQQLYCRVLGRLTYIAERVEIALGLGAFASPPDFEEDDE